MSRTRILKISKNDLVWSGFLEKLLNAVVAELIGLIGFLLTWIAIALFVPALFDIPNLITILVIVGGLSYGIIGQFRNRILLRLSRRGFVFIFHVQRAFRILFWIAIVLSIYITGVAYGRFPTNAYLTLLIAGLFFLLAMPRIVFARMIRKLREARLCILQFLGDLDGGKTNYFWLRTGLTRAERHLRQFDRSIPRGGVYLWAYYSLFTSVRIETQLEWLGGWLLDPKITSELNSFTNSIRVQANAAEIEGVKPPRGKFDVMNFLASRAFPAIWRRNDNISNLLVMTILSSAILAFLSLNSPFPLPFPQWYLQGASLALFGSFMALLVSRVRRKPPGKAMDLISEIYGATRLVDESYDRGNLLYLVTLLKRRQKTIRSLEPILRRTSTNVYNELSQLLVAISGATTASNSSNSQAVDSLLMLPATRVTISDLRKYAEYWLTQNAYSYDES